MDFSKFTDNNSIFRNAVAELYNAVAMIQIETLAIFNGTSFLNNFAPYIAGMWTDNICYVSFFNVTFDGCYVIDRERAA